MWLHDLLESHSQTVSAPGVFLGDGKDLLAVTTVFVCSRLTALEARGVMGSLAFRATEADQLPAGISQHRPPRQDTASVVGHV